MMAHFLCHMLLLVFLSSRAVVLVNSSNNAISCGYDVNCQAIVKMMAAVDEIKSKLDEPASCPDVNEKLDKLAINVLDIQGKQVKDAVLLGKQAKDLEEQKEKLDRSLASTAAISKQLERLSADFLSHDGRLKAHDVSQNNLYQLVQSIQGAQPRARDCSDIRERGSSVNGVYRVDLGSDNKRIEVDVYCDFKTLGQSWLVFQRRKDGSVDFDRNWNDYANGFGALTGEFWLGNEKLSLLTMNRKYKLRIELEDFSGVKRWAEYSTFFIKPSTDKYRLTAYGISGTAGPGDNLAYHNGKLFGTKDANNGFNVARCNPPITGGWWFNGCLFGNLNDRYKSIYWYYVGHSYYSLKATEMKIAAV